jgi:hypothetical protein
LTGIVQLVREDDINLRPSRRHKGSGDANFDALARKDKNMGVPEGMNNTRVISKVGKSQEISTSYKPPQ